MVVSSNPSARYYLDGLLFTFVCCEKCFGGWKDGKINQSTIIEPNIIVDYFLKHRWCVWDGRMVGADESTELWRHPILLEIVYMIDFCLPNLVLFSTLLNPGKSFSWRVIHKMFWDLFGVISHEIWRQFEAGYNKCTSKEKVLPKEMLVLSPSSKAK